MGRLFHSAISVVNCFPYINWAFVPLRSDKSFLYEARSLISPVQAREIFQSELCCLVFDIFTLQHI